MSFSASLRRSAPSISRTLKQEASSQNGRRASKVHEAVRRLPPEKLRALISLYHQSDTFITQENLLERINEALVPSKRDQIAGPIMNTLPGINTMWEALERRQSAPKVAQSQDGGDAKPVSGINGTWSFMRPKRERKVIEALYGIDTTVPERAMPGLEALDEAGESLRREAQEDAKLEGSPSGDASRYAKS